MSSSAEASVGEVAKWDRWNEGGGPKYPHEKVVQFCFRNFPPEAREGCRALDLGCGSGVHTAFLAREGYEVTATDISREGVKNTRQRLQKENLSAQVTVAGADELAFPDAAFDLVICAGVLDAAGPEVAAGVAAGIGGKLAAGGRALFIFASDEDFRVQEANVCGLHGYDRGEVERLFRDAAETVWIDSYTTTYEGGRYLQKDWLVTLRK